MCHGAHPASNSQPESPRVRHVTDGGARVTTVRADDSARWVYLDLDTARDDGAPFAGWDLAFQRFKLRFEGYYDTAGSGGFPRFRWARVAP